MWKKNYWDVLQTITLQVTSWVECGSEAWVPTHKLKFINFYLSDKDKYFSFLLKKRSELNSCCIYFTIGYCCCILQQKHNESINSYFDFIRSFQVSFGKENKLFRFGMRKYCLIDIGEYDWLPDSHGFEIM